MFLHRYAGTDHLHRIFQDMLSKERGDYLRFSSFRGSQTAGQSVCKVAWLLCHRDCQKQREGKMSRALLDFLYDLFINSLEDIIS